MFIIIKSNCVNAAPVLELQMEVKHQTQLTEADGQKRSVWTDWSPAATFFAGNASAFSLRCSASGLPERLLRWTCSHLTDDDRTPADCNALNATIENHVYF